MKLLLCFVVPCFLLSANPLLVKKFPVPWDEIRPEHITPAIEQHLKEAESRRAKLKANHEAPTWENTIVALEAVTEELNHAWGLISHLQAVNNSPALRREFNAMQPRVVRFQSELAADQAIYSRVKSLAESPAGRALQGPQARLLEVMLDDYRRAGVSLPEKDRQRVLELRAELARLSTQFAQNALDSLNAFEHYATEEEVKGLPPTALRAAAAAAKAKGKPGYRFTLQAPSLLPVLQYADNPALREKLSRAQNTIAASGALDNRPIIERILALRQELASLLGYRNFADYQLEPRMARQGAKVQSFLADLEAKTQAAFARETAALRALRKEIEGSEDLRQWDIAYYTQKLRQKQFAFDQDQLRPYFELGSVLNGLFGLVKDLYGIEVQPAPMLPVWHPQVRAYTITDGGKQLATFYMDLHPRESKRSGAWQNSLRVGVTGEPHVGIIAANLTPPDEKGHALLTHQEVSTIFHEFGHLLHLALAEGPVRPLNGTAVAWDFVELPSQIMENFVWEKRVLDRFARHFETGDLLPAELFAKLEQTRTFAAATAQMRQLSLGAMDIQLHTDYRVQADFGDPVTYARRIAQRFTAAPLEPEACPICNFTHIFAGGYAAGYYSYKWAEVLDADAFTKFKQAGVISRETGALFRRTVLSRGNMKPAEQLFRDFMGRDPDPTALLRRTGLLASDASAQTAQN